MGTGRVGGARFEAREIWRDQVWLRVAPWVAAGHAAVFCLLYALTMSCALDEWVLCGLSLISMTLT